MRQGLGMGDACFEWQQERRTPTRKNDDQFRRYHDQTMIPQIEHNQKAKFV
jgi:hypothetical protein